MSYQPQKLPDLTLEVMGIEVTVKGAIYHPHVPATQIDPPESEFVELDDNVTVVASGVDISDLFRYPFNADKLHEAILVAME